jgi:hypothetical protein
MVKVQKDMKPEDLKHHFVFLERIEKDGHVAYDSGEYVVLNASPNVLYVAKPSVGYDFLSKYNSGKPVVGTEPWTVVTASYDRDRLVAIARENYIWGKKGGKNWIASVYEEAVNKATALFRDLQEALPNVTESELSDNDKTIVASSAQVLLSKKMRKLISETGCQQHNVKAIVERIFFELGQ